MIQNDHLLVEVVFLRKCQLTTAEHQKKSALNRQRCLNDVANALHPLSCEIVFTKIILGKERNLLHMA